LGQTNPPLEVEAENGDIAYHDSAELVEPSSDGENGSSQDNLKPEQTTNVLEHETTSMPSVFDHYITYSCLLIPRMPQHMLNSNLASYLFKWMGQLCLAYGWRLEHLSIHSNHVQWIAGAPLNTSPAYLVRILRQKTSSYIFTQFPPLSNDNPSGDFWAPGFFITGGRQSIHAHLVEKYINAIREHQGVNNTVIYN
jgi:REP element-mobilizing transposase RayT